MGDGSKRIHVDVLYYGLNALSGNMVMADRKQLKSPNGLILGTPGSSKSFSAKREITNVFLVASKKDTVICDPEAEYASLVNRLGGQVVKISPTSRDYMNPMDLNPNYSEDESPPGPKERFHSFPLRADRRRQGRIAAH